LIRELVDNLSLSNRLEEAVVKSVKVLLLFLTLFIIHKVIVFCIRYHFKRVYKRRNILYDQREKTLVSICNSALKYIMYPFFVIGTLSIIGVDTVSLVTGTGFVAIAIGFGFQDLLKDIISGLFIVFEGAFSIHDMITIDNISGEVIDIGLKYTQVKAITGEVQIINNREIVKIINYSKTKFIILSNKFSVALDSDINYLFGDLNLFLKSLRMKYNEFVVEDPYVKGVDKISNFSIGIEVQTKVIPKYMQYMKREMDREILTYLHNNNIKIPYPTYVIRGEENGKLGI